jgi:hypothetical protein
MVENNINLSGSFARSGDGRLGQRKGRRIHPQSTRGESLDQTLMLYLTDLPSCISS